MMNSPESLSSNSVSSSARVYMSCMWHTAASSNRTNWTRWSVELPAKGWHVDSVIVRDGSLTVSVSTSCPSLVRTNASDTVGASVAKDAEGRAGTMSRAPSTAHRARKNRMQSS